MVCSDPYRSEAASRLGSSRVADPSSDGTNLEWSKTVVVARQKGEMDIEMKSDSVVLSVCGSFQLSFN
jgi:hypothetical protein